MPKHWTKNDLNNKDKYQKKTFGGFGISLVEVQVRTL